MKKQLISGVSAMVGAAIGAVAVQKVSKEEVNKVKAMSDKHLALFLMMNQWVHVKQQGKSLVDYLVKHDFKTIAVYGMSYAGERLIEEVKDSEVKIAYGIDRKADGIYTDISIVSPDDKLEDVDAVVVTAIFFMDEIEKDLSSKLSCPILSLEDILYDM